jgi:hypothetical protein
MCQGIHQTGGTVSDGWFRRRDADGCVSDDRAPEEANDSGPPFLGGQIVSSKLLRFKNEAAKLMAFGELEPGSQTTCP